MELVEGEPIDVFAESRRLDIPGCIELVLKVTEAVERAHRNLIVHRDIKPSNILVTADGTPKLLDFGIAKDLFDSGATQTVAALTPEYTSPEQVLGAPVTVATDVYGLGGLLYRLLTGSPPHPVRNKSSADWLRLVVEEDVIAPATLRAHLRGDLENILRKALHRDPNRRYQSVLAFAVDLRQFLEHRPVQATPDSLAYRTRMLLRRNKLLSAVTALAVVSMVVGTAVSIQQAQRAQHRFDQVRQLANIFLFDFESAIRNIPGTLPARELVASTGQQYLKELAGESQNDASLQREVAEAYERLGDVQGALLSSGGRSAELESLLQALEIRRQLGDHQSADSALRRKYIELAALLGFRLQSSRNAEEAAKWSDEAIRLSETWVAAEPANIDALSAATEAFRRGATTQEIAGHIDRAMASFDKSVAAGRRAIQVAPDDQTIVLRVSSAERSYGELLHTVKRYRDALAHGKRALELTEPLWQQNPQDRPVRAAFLAANSTVGISERALGENDVSHLAAALPYLQRAHDLTKEDMLADPLNMRRKDTFIVYAHRLCSLLTEMKRFDEAIVLYQKTDEVARELVRLEPANRRSLYLLGKNQTDLGWLLFASGRTAEASRAFLASDEGYLPALKLDPYDAVILECRASQFEGLARAALAMHNESEARRWMTQSLEVMRGMVSRNASAREYIYDYSEKVEFARRLGLVTDGLD